MLSFLLCGGGFFTTENRKYFRKGVQNGQVICAGGELLQKSKKGDEKVNLKNQKKKMRYEDHKKTISFAVEDDENDDDEEGKEKKSRNSVYTHMLIQRVSLSSSESLFSLYKCLVGIIWENIICVYVLCYFRAVNRCEGECEAKKRERERENEWRRRAEKT